MSEVPVYLGGQIIRAVIFDFGEVLSWPPPPETIAGMAAVFKLTPAKFREYYYAERYRYDRAEITPEQYWSAIAQDAGVQLAPEQIEWLRRTDVEMWSNMNPAMLRWAEQLRALGLRTAVLSNMHADMAAAVRSSFRWIAEFDCFVLSAEVGLAKPDPQIFRYSLDCLQVDAGQAMFIDDKERNTSAAKAMGIAGVCANSAQSIREQLKAAGWTASLPQ